MSNSEIKDDEFVIYGCPERTAGTPESYRNSPTALKMPVAPLQPWGI